jgi:hypothetical protein
MNLAACGALPAAPHTGTWYRAIDPKYKDKVFNTRYTRVSPSRFYEGASARPQFETLYLGENHNVTLFEGRAMLGSPLYPGGAVANPARPWHLQNIDVILQRVVDLTDVAVVQTALNTTAQELTGDWEGYRFRGPHTPVRGPVGTAPTQALGAALYAVRRVEGFITLSARDPLHRVLVVFPQRLRRGSLLRYEYTDVAGARRVFAIP